MPTAENVASLMIVAAESLKITTESADGDRIVELSSSDVRYDALDDFNHTRLRRARILETLFREQRKFEESAAAESSPRIAWHPAPASTSMEFYKSVHSSEILTFLQSAHDAWEELGPLGRDPSGCITVQAKHDEAGAASSSYIPPLIPANMPLPRLGNNRQRPGQHVLGQMGYYCNDICTPIFDQLARELLEDAGVMKRAVDLAVAAAIDATEKAKSTTFAVPTHPGHHAAQDSFGGYCYVNHAAAVAKALQQQQQKQIANEPPMTIAILDVDYHCGNGTASIVDDDPTVLFISLHCDPNYEYPFHVGFADEEDDVCSKDHAASRTLHRPLPPKTAWPAYKVALEQGLSKIAKEFQPDALIVSLGLDTYAQDPCALRRAGFELQGQDYVDMGRLIGEYSSGIPSVIFIQEGGYRMDAVPKAAADVVISCHAARQGESAALL